MTRPLQVSRDFTTSKAKHYKASSGTLGWFLPLGSRGAAVEMLPCVAVVCILVLVRGRFAYVTSALADLLCTAYSTLSVDCLALSAQPRAVSETLSLRDSIDSTQEGRPDENSFEVLPGSTMVIMHTVIHHANRSKFQGLTVVVAQIKNREGRDASWSG